MPLGETSVHDSLPSVCSTQWMPLVRNVCEPKSTDRGNHATDREPEISRVVHQAADLAGRDTKGRACVSGAVVGPRGNAFFQLARCAVHDGSRAFLALDVQ